MSRLSAAATAAMFALFLSGFGTGTAGAGLDIYIDKSSQLMTVAVDGVLHYTWKVSTGKRRYETPSGTFRPFRMEPDHFSTEWDDAPMPNSIFFTDQGHAIHGSPYTRRLGRAASHGCVRLAPQDAATLYSLVGQQGLGNTRIVILEGGIADAGEIY
jgi:lipoprotein-anchoring transpeptidase ErfK/SrfK